jgi:molecular chaperone DnaJ
MTTSDPDSIANQGPPRRRLSRFSGHLKSALAGGAARLLADGTVELRLEEDEAATGGMAILSLETEIVCRRCDTEPGTVCERCGDTGQERELVSFWLTIPAGAADGTVLRPSVLPIKLVKPVDFVVRLPAQR